MEFNVFVDGHNVDAVQPSVGRGVSEANGRKRDDDVALDTVGGEPPLADQGGLKTRRVQAGQGSVHADPGIGRQPRRAAHHRAHDTGGKFPSETSPLRRNPRRGPEAPRTLGYREGHEFHGSERS